MKKTLLYIIFAVAFILSGCDVHEFPESPYFPDSSDKVEFPDLPDKPGDQTGKDDPLMAKLCVRLNYDTHLTMWDHLYDGNSVIENGLGNVYDSSVGTGQMRYVIHAIPVSKERGVQTSVAQEYQFTKDVTEGYDSEFVVEVPSGEYDIMVWSDFVQESEIVYYVGDFSGIMLEEESSIGDDSSDAFRGMTPIQLSVDLKDNQVDTVDVAMQRPMAKFEFVANDLPEFAEKVANLESATKSGADLSVDISDYKVRFYYVGFKPDVYSMYSDKPVDSSLGVTFESTMSQLSNSEVKIGFDYVFVGDQSTAVTLQVGVFDDEDTRISLTKPITVPLMRGRHTVLTGAFLTPNASQGVQINPEYDGDHNFILP